MIGGLSLEGWLRTNNAGRLNYIGDISYSLYLVQPFVFKVISIAAPAMMFITPTIWVLIAVPLTLLLAAISYEFVEKPVVSVFKHGNFRCLWKPSEVKA